MAELLFSLFFVLFAVVAVQNLTGVVAKRVVGLVWRQFANRQMDGNQNAPTSVTVDKSTQAHTTTISEIWQMFAQNTPTPCCQANNSRLNLCNCAQCTNKQRFGSAVNKHKHSTKALRKTQQYQKVLVCKWQRTRFCNKKNGWTVPTVLFCVLRFVELCKQSVKVDAVYHCCLFNCFLVSQQAMDASHSVAGKNSCAFRFCLQNVHNSHVLCYHCSSP